MADDIPFRKSMDFAYGTAKEMAPGVRRIVANNPSPFTFKGTNTYLVGTGELMLIDPGPDDDAHFAATMAAIGQGRLTHVLITHTHRDHTDGLARLIAATGAKTAGFGRLARNKGATITSPSGSEYVDRDFAPDVKLGDGGRLAGDAFAFTALHTPGHAPDHLCFALEGTGILFSGDHVMSWNTSVVAPPEGNMGDYMRSLDKIAGRDDKVFLPGHGGRFEEPNKLVRAFITHRIWRENAILECVKQGNRTIRAVVPIVYRGLDARLVNAAELSVQAHVEHLIERGLLRTDHPLSRDRELFPV